MGDDGRRDHADGTGRLRQPTPDPGPGPQRPEGWSGAGGALGGPSGPGGPGGWISGRDAELLVSGGRVEPGDARAAGTASRLAGLLAAAAGPGTASPEGLDPAREEAALAAFRAAHRARAARTRRPRGAARSGGGKRSARPAIRMAVAAMASVIALSGVVVAVAATTGRLPLPGQGAGGGVPAGSTPPAATPRTATPGGGPGLSPGTGVPRSSTAPAPGSLAWCEAYLRSDAEGAARRCRKLVRAQGQDGKGKDGKGRDGHRKKGHKNGRSDKPDRTDKSDRAHRPGPSGHPDHPDHPRRPAGRGGHRRRPRHPHPTRTAERRTPAPPARVS